MQKCLIRAIGRLPEPWQREAVENYAERLAPHLKLTIQELPEGHQKSAKPDISRTQQTEAASLLRGRTGTDTVIALDETGKELDSKQFSEKWESWTSGGKTPIFLIGGSWGLAPSVRQESDIILSLGKMTFPHGLARVMLMEQLYRCQMIRAGKPYHK